LVQQLIIEIPVYNLSSVYSFGIFGIFIFLNFSINWFTIQIPSLFNLLVQQLIIEIPVYVRENYKLNNSLVFLFYFILSGIFLF
jgi:hypothetical protein